MRPVIIIGASGHGKVVADIIQKSGDRVAGFLDDNPMLHGSFVGFPVLGSVSQYREFDKAEFVIAIGDAAIREKIANRLEGIFWYTAIHPTAAIAGLDVNIAKGTVVMANAVINSGTIVGRHCIINSGAVLEHDNIIEDFVHVSVGVKLAGTVHVGKSTWIGIRASVNNNLSICEDCVIGAGAVVIRDIEKAGIYVGVPAKRLEEESVEDRKIINREFVRGRGNSLIRIHHFQYRGASTQVANIEESIA